MTSGSAEVPENGAQGMVRRVIRGTASSAFDVQFASDRTSSNDGSSIPPTTLLSSLLDQSLTSSSEGECPPFVLPCLLLVLILRSRNNRSSRVGKAAAGTADAEYRKVLDNLIADLLTTVHLPEWPGSQLFLDVLCRYMVRQSLSRFSRSMRT